MGLDDKMAERLESRSAILSSSHLGVEIRRVFTFTKK